MGSNMGWVKYLSPNEGMIQTATLSLDSSRPQTWMDALTIAPDDTPTGIPMFHNSLVVSIALSEWTGTTSSIKSRSKTAGTKPAPIPWILWGPCSPIFSPPLDSVRSICSCGSTPMVIRFGFLGGQSNSLQPLINCDTPVKVPPVPTPEMNKSMLPSTSSQISGPVVSRWTLGFAGFSNCCNMNPFPSRPSMISLALASAPLTAVSFGVRTTSAPNASNIIRRSTLIVSGMVRMHRYPRSRAMNARAIPVLPEHMIQTVVCFRSQYSYEVTTGSTGFVLQLAWSI
mmetsp:Transcript_15667/g.28246  ORF Transcript_15667/g.28246 Transcript_15667/m.28246 type:complete len:285 (-) Transcript_15667:326-1180(-)